MKISIQAAAAITLFATQAVHAQGAVQWKVSDGGNGHWYQGILTSSAGASWTAARATAISRGADLACVRNAIEANWLFATIVQAPSLWSGSAGPWVGGLQAQGSEEPAGGWVWVDGTSVNPTIWSVGQPDNATYCGGDNNRIGYWNAQQGSPRPYLEDSPDSALLECPPSLLGRRIAAVIEWSADCNGDGIVDYGQCRDGSLPDYDGDNIPDCCEAGAPCVVGNYPVQWRIEDGGNGRWYEVIAALGTWDESRTRARAMGSDLCAITSGAENDHVLALVARAEQWCADGAGYWLGGFRQAGQWHWVSGESFAFSYFGCDNPGDVQTHIQWYRVPSGCPPLGTIVWDDQFPSGCPLLEGNPGFVAEWSADCNNDGIVDYGQILQGQLADTNADGVPDICQGPTCADADIYRDFNVNGADLGILLSQWGPNTPLTESDLNDDGVVNGADLGLLLSFWGACP